MMTVYWMWIGSEEKPHPRVDFTSRKNRHHDWLRLGEILRGAVPMDEAFVASIGIEVRTRRPFDVLAHLGRPLISARAREALAGLRLDGVRFLPGFVNGKPFFYLLPAMIDCLDHERSEIQAFPSGAVIIRRYVFRRDRIPDASIFCIPESAHVFATDAVKEAVSSSGLVGFQFTDWETPPPGTFVS